MIDSIAGKQRCTNLAPARGCGGTATDSGLAITALLAIVINYWLPGSYIHGIDCRIIQPMGQATQFLCGYRLTTWQGLRLIQLYQGHLWRATFKIGQGKKSICFRYLTWNMLVTLLLERL
jgi:hypothetical protein